MRALVPPPPSLRCELCGGELRFKRIANRVYGLDNEIFVCVNCGHCGCFTNPKHRYYEGCRREACLHRAFVFVGKANADPSGLDQLSVRHICRGPRRIFAQERHVISEAQALGRGGGRNGASIVTLSLTQLKKIAQRHNNKRLLTIGARPTALAVRRPWPSSCRPEGKSRQGADLLLEEASRLRPRLSGTRWEAFLPSAPR